MNTSKIHEGFNGYGKSPLHEGEHLIRERLVGCLGSLRSKNEGCLVKAREEGREKILERILSVKTRVERIADDAEKSMSGVKYKLGSMPAQDEAAARTIDERIEEIIGQCAGIVDNLSCHEPDMNILERYTVIMEHLGEVEELLHRRMMIFKRMQVYG